MAKKPDTAKPMTAIQLALAETFLKPFETPQQMRDWMCNFFDIDFPMGTVDPDSNTSPVEWMFEVYTAMRNNEGNEKPVYVVYSARDAYKTLGCSALEVILMVHLNATVAHMAAITSQSAKAFQYINSFVRKIEPYLEHHGGAVTSKNVRNISIKNANGDEVYVQVIVATLQGSNSNHTLFFACDEVDVVQYPQAFEEAKMIPGVQNGKFPITLYTSTRKFAFGLMQKEIERAQENGHPIRHWNILDVTEHCSPKRNKKDQGTVKRYIAKNLPLLQISPEEHLSLPEEKRDGYEAIEAYVGCVDCKLLPVCKTRLANRPENDRGGLWKPIDFTINQFSKIEPDMAEAQLLCWKPSSTGLVYPRFDQTEGENTITVSNAYYQLMGDEKPDVTLPELILKMSELGIQFYVGGDWGFRHNFALIVGAILPSGDFWIVECFVMAGLEFPEMMKYSEYIRDKYMPRKWFMDTAQPMFIKSFKKAGMPCKEFKKDVSGGISSIRGQIIDASGRRRLKVLLTEENRHIIKGFHSHHFRTDAAGNITAEPDDENHADALDSLRYMGQNLFATKGGLVAPDLREREQDILKTRSSLPQFQPGPGQRNYFNEIFEIASNEVDSKGKGKSATGSVFWDFSND
jgi:hypothetical protein